MSTSVAPSRKRTVATAVLGNLVEYFDWLAFAMFAPIFASQFFPSASAAGAVLDTLAVFAIGMFVRPVGAILFGRFADRGGRKPALVAAIVTMGAGTALIGLAPTYAQIGVLAPILLTLSRVAQGLGAAGAWPTAVTYLMELAPPHRRCFYGSLFATSAVGGALIVSIIGSGLSSLLTNTQLHQWGWRLPFLIGGALGIGLLLLRNRLSETTEFQRSTEPVRRRGSLRALARQHRRALVLAAVFVGGANWTSTAWTTAVPALGQQVSSPATMFRVTLLVTGVVTIGQPLLGLLADRIGVHPLLAVFAIGFSTVGSLALLRIGPGFGNLVFCYGSGIVCMACVSAVMPKILAAMYPPEVRALGIALPQGITTAVLAGTSPLVATWLVGGGAAGWFAVSGAAGVLAAWAAATAALRRAPDAPVRELPTPSPELTQPEEKAA